jgi:D-galactose 1-dehydrogenase
MDMLAAVPELDAVVVCTPPQARHEVAAAALAAGKHVFLEKPPGGSLEEVADLRARATAAGLTLFAGWHSRFAAGVAPAKAWLATRDIQAAQIRWKEDVRKWHPGQAWIWRAEGLGVFDPGINALSILTEILQGPVSLAGASLERPTNREAPIAARLALRDARGASIEAEFDWRQVGPQTWDIEVETADGRLLLSHGGARLAIDGRRVVEGGDREYAGLYARFAELIASGGSEVDATPLALVLEAFRIGRVQITEPFLD